jgi:hypothetical protein
MTHADVSGQFSPRQERRHCDRIRLISVVIIGAITLVGTQLSGVFNSIATALGTAS